MFIVTMVHGQWRDLCFTFSVHLADYSNGYHILKLINNSLSLNKGNHERDSVWISDLN